MEASGPRLVQYSEKSAVFSIWDVADIHWGNVGCSKEKLRKDVRTIKADPYSMWFLGGDYCDFISPGDPRFDPETVDPDMSVNDLARLSAKMVEGVTEELIPIRDKCIGALYGNHEHQYMKRREQADVHDTVCAQLDSPNMRYCGVTDIWFEYNRNLRKACRVLKKPQPCQLYKPNQQRLRVVVHHGFGAAQTAGGRVNALVREMSRHHGPLARSVI
jgi:hypothetical protein